MTHRLIPAGLGLYVRRFQPRRHQSPEALAKRFADHGVRWAAIGGPWQEPDDRGGVRTRLINDVETCRRITGAMAAAGVLPYVWGYPWLGHEEPFADAIGACARDHPHALIDAEAGANPTRAAKGPDLERAEAGATRLIALMKERAFMACGLSTYGSGARLRWFPLRTYARALAAAFGANAFLGGQTYTVPKRRIRTALADFARIAEHASDKTGRLELVPNFGTYTRTKNGKARPKTPAELETHLATFFAAPHPIRAAIGWAENFVTNAQWRVLARWAQSLEQKACTLPTAP